jgi:hypothetical protein
MKVPVENTCPFCGDKNTVMVEAQDFMDWRNGKLAQDAFDYLSPDEREIIISGVCSSCWDATFGVDEDEEY